MSYTKNETSPSVSEDVARQIKAVRDPLTQKLAHFSEVMKEVRDEPAHRRHKGPPPQELLARPHSTLAGLTAS